MKHTRIVSGFILTVSLLLFGVSCKPSEKSRQKAAFKAFREFEKTPIPVPDSVLKPDSVNAPGCTKGWGFRLKDTLQIAQVLAFYDDAYGRLGLTKELSNSFDHRHESGHSPPPAVSGARFMTDEETYLSADGLVKCGLSVRFASGDLDPFPDDRIGPRGAPMASASCEPNLKRRGNPCWTDNGGFKNDGPKIGPEEPPEQEPLRPIRPGNRNRSKKQFAAFEAFERKFRPPFPASFARKSATWRRGCRIEGDFAQSRPFQSKTLLGFYADTLAKLGLYSSKRDTGSGWRKMVFASPNEAGQDTMFLAFRDFFAPDSSIHCQEILSSRAYADTSGLQELALDCRPYLGKNINPCSVLRDHD